MYSAPGAGQMPRVMGVCWRTAPPTKNVSVPAVASITAARWVQASNATQSQVTSMKVSGCCPNQYVKR